jgi:hypothetical protein
MRLSFAIETRDLVPVLERTYYNNACWEVSKNQLFDVTHIIEKYDDVCEDPDYHLGTLVDDKFKLLFTGYGDPVPDGDRTCGGVFITINVEQVLL